MFKLLFSFWSITVFVLQSHSGTQRCSGSKHWHPLQTWVLSQERYKTQDQLTCIDLTVSRSQSGLSCTLSCVCIFSVTRVWSSTALSKGQTGPWNLESGLERDSWIFQQWWRWCWWRWWRQRGRRGGGEGARTRGSKTPVFLILCFVPETRFPLKAICQMLKRFWCVADIFRSGWCWKIFSLVFQNCEEVIYLFIYLFFLFDSYGILVYALAWTLGLSNWHVVLQWLLWLKGLPELGTRLTEAIWGHSRPMSTERAPVLVFMLICEDIPSALYISCSRTPWLSPLNGLSMWESPQASDNNVSFFLLSEFGHMAICLVFRHVPMATARSFGCEKAAGLAEEQWRCASSDGGQGWAHLKESSLLAGEGRARCTIIRPACEKISEKISGNICWKWWVVFLFNELCL